MPQPDPRPFHDDFRSIEFGTIQMWSGAITNIPDGWVLCDGNNGTPDMSDKFAKGVNSPTDNTLTVGGRHTYELADDELPGHSHQYSTDEVTVDHSHPMSHRDVDGQMRSDRRIHGDDYAIYSSSEGHSHPFSVDYAGGGNTLDARPPFYDVAFITKP